MSGVKKENNRVKNINISNKNIRNISIKKGIIFLIALSTVVCIACAIFSKLNGDKLLTTGAGDVALAKTLDIKVGEVKVKVEKHNEKKMVITWKKVDSAEQYYVYRRSEKTCYKLVDKVEKAKFVDKDIKARTNYTYKVKAFASRGTLEKQLGSDETEKTVESGTDGQVTVGVTTASVTSGDLINANEQMLLAKSKKVKVYIEPKKARVVIGGECFVEGLAAYGKDYVPKNFDFVHKVGVNTTSFYTSNSISYDGTLVTPLERVAAYNPDRVYFLIGINEANNGDPKATINNFDKMRKMLKKVNDNVEIVLLALPPCGKHSSLNVPTPSKRDNFNSEFKNYSKKYDQVYYYDYTDILNDGDGYLKGSCDAGDGCHWNASAVVSVAKLISKWDKENF
ncbi:MAG: SGNH/GDSL hydrolase family protein [Lachnospiraceae bacterium]|nr:SGNH/GDSL hydrolase family protein [Lachnospiraceae bacterium]